MAYKVKEVFYSLQGEGYHSGRPTIFCRFSGCNLWSGRDEDRTTALCNFCDTDFVGTNGSGGGIYSSSFELVEHLLTYWPSNSLMDPIVEFTGGEPLLQLDNNLILACKKKNFSITLQTNGTLPIPKDIDWVCVSPKANVKLVVHKANELKIVYPQSGLSILDFEDFEADYYYLQALDNKNIDINRAEAVAYCLAHPKWRISLQIHKALGIK